MHVVPRNVGGCTFAERPSVAAPDATIIWHAALDPGTLRVVAVPPVGDRGEDILDPAALEAMMAIATDEDGREHVVLSDGLRHLRLDVDAGSLAAGGPVVLRYHLQGLASAEAMMLPLRRFLYLCRHRRFARTLAEPAGQMTRWISLLRVHDAERAGASQREIASALYGPVADQEWQLASDTWRSRVRRLVREARAMAAGGYRTLLCRRSPPRR